MFHEVNNKIFIKLETKKIVDEILIDFKGIQSNLQENLNKI